MSHLQNIRALYINDFDALLRLIRRKWTERNGHAADR